VSAHDYCRKPGPGGIPHDSRVSFFFLNTVVHFVCFLVGLFPFSPMPTMHVPRAPHCQVGKDHVLPGNWYLGMSRHLIFLGTCCNGVYLVPRCIDDSYQYELQLEGLQLCHWAAPLSPLANMSRRDDWSTPRHKSPVVGHKPGKTLSFGTIAQPRAWHDRMWKTTCPTFLRLRNRPLRTLANSSRRKHNALISVNPRVR